VYVEAMGQRYAEEAMVEQSYDKEAIVE